MNSSDPAKRGAFAGTCANSVVGAGEFPRGWAQTSLAGWRAWFAGGPLWRALACLFLLINLSFLPWPRPGQTTPGGHPAARSPWNRFAWDSQLFRDRPGADFFGIYEAGVRFWRGMDPYSVNAISEAHPPLGAPYCASFRYIPLFVPVVAAPLALLPPWPAFAGWLLLNQLALWFNLGITCGIAARRAGGTGASPPTLRALGALWLLWFPLHVEWHMGQFSFLMGCLLFWTALAWLARGTGAPGDAAGGGAGACGCACTGRAGFLAWALSTIVKNWTAIAWFEWLRRGRAAAIAATAWLLFVAATTLAYFAAVPSAREYFFGLGTRGRLAGATDEVYWGRQGVQMIPAVLFSGGKLQDQVRAGGAVGEGFADPARATNALLSGAALLLILFVGARRVLRRDATSPPLLLLALVWLWWFFAYLDCWEHHYVMLAPLLALLLATGLVRSRWLWVCAALWASPSLWWPASKVLAAASAAAPDGNLLATSAGWTLLWRGTVIAYFLHRPVAVVGLFLVLARAALREPGARADR